MNTKTTYAIAEFSSCGGASESSTGARRQEAGAAGATTPEHASAISHMIDDSVHHTSEQRDASPGVDNSPIEQMQDQAGASFPDSCVCDGDRDSGSSTD